MNVCRYCHPVEFNVFIVLSSSGTLVVEHQTTNQAFRIFWHLNQYPQVDSLESNDLSIDIDVRIRITNMVGFRQNIRDTFYFMTHKNL